MIVVVIVCISLDHIIDLLILLKLLYLVLSYFMYL